MEERKEPSFHTAVVKGRTRFEVPIKTRCMGEATTVKRKQRTLPVKVGAFVLVDADMKLVEGDHLHCLSYSSSTVGYGGGFSFSFCAIPSTILD